MVSTMRWGIWRWWARCVALIAGALTTGSHKESVLILQRIRNYFVFSSTNYSSMLAESLKTHHFYTFEWYNCSTPKCILKAVLVIIQHMGAELHKENDRINHIGGRTENTHDSIRNVQRNARQDFGLRVKWYMKSGAFWLAQLTYCTDLECYVEPLL